MGIVVAFNCCFVLFDFRLQIPNLLIRQLDRVYCLNARILWLCSSLVVPLVGKQRFHVRWLLLLQLGVVIQHLLVLHLSARH